MKILKNPNLGRDNNWPSLKHIPYPSTDVKQALDVMTQIPHFAPTPLREAPEFATRLGIDRLYIKDESQRMGLGMFKALGGYYYIAKQAQKSSLKHHTFVCATAGNHGLAVAAAAKHFGANAVVIIDENVPEVFKSRLLEHGAHVIRDGKTYEAALKIAKESAEAEGWELVSDQSTEDYVDIPFTIMEGYSIMLLEVMQQLEGVPTHIVLQAGVGGMAGAIAALARKTWGDEPNIIVVEPAMAPAIYGSIVDGAPSHHGSGVSNMGRLDCKEPSLIALKSLSRDANFFATIDEDEAENGMREAKSHGFASTPSGAAGLAALVATEKWRDELGINSNSRALAFLTEGPAI